MKLEHIQALMPVIDAGIRASGLQVFAGGRGRVLQDALDALQTMAETAEQQEDKDNGSDVSDQS